MNGMHMEVFKKPVCITMAALDTSRCLSSEPVQLFVKTAHHEEGIGICTLRGGRIEQQRLNLNLEGTVWFYIKGSGTIFLSGTKKENKPTTRDSKQKNLINDIIMRRVSK